MSVTSPDRVEVSPGLERELRRLIRAGTTAQQLVQRAMIVLLAAAGLANPETLSANLG